MKRGATFNERWAAYAAARGLGADPTARAPATTVGEARRDALEFFSWGVAFDVHTAGRFAELLAADAVQCGHDGRSNQNAC